MKNLRDYKTIIERREAIEQNLTISLKNIGYYSLDDEIAGSKNCENMIGVAQVPMGIAGPLRLASARSGQAPHGYYIPLATTEGALVASVNRGCKAITESGGASVNSHRIGATRGSVFYTGSIAANQKLYLWLKFHEKQLAIAAKQTSRHLTFQKHVIKTVGKYAFVRFYFDTQDAMGMNMATIASQKIAELIEKETKIPCLSIAGNFDIDKKPAWLNVIENRGIKVWAEATINEQILKTVLKTTAQEIYRVWLAKCMIGSAMSGSLGFNAQYANIIAALFIATGQDAAHVVEGSMGITTTEVITREKGNNLYISVYLPDLMVGTVGGGTSLETQKEALKILGVSGGSPPAGGGKNAIIFAEIAGAAVLAGELSLLSSLAEGSLTTAHQKLARGKGEG